MYRIHPAAEIFPPMAEQEFRGLVEDIRLYGQIEPIVLYDNMVLDGRHRLKACEEIGIEPRFVEWDNGKPPEDYVLSKNLHRRHLNESQRAMVAAKMADLGAGRPKTVSIDTNYTNAQAAEKLNVSVPSVKRAKRVLSDGSPEEITAVESGQAAVSSVAQKLAKESPPTMPNKSGPRIAVPEGMTLETHFRTLMDKERKGLTTEQAAAAANMSVSNYRCIRDIVLLSGLDLPKTEASLVRIAINHMNQDQRVRHLYAAVKPIADRIWGTGPRDINNHENTAARRVEEFERAFGYIIQGCLSAKDVEVPAITSERANRAVQNIAEAERSLRALKTKLLGVVE